MRMRLLPGTDFHHRQASESRSGLAVLLLVAGGVFAGFAFRELADLPRLGHLLPVRAGFVAVLAVLYLLARRQRGDGFFWGSVAFMAVLSAGSATMSWLNGSGIHRALPSFVLIIVVAMPFWPRVQHVAMGATALALPPLVALWATRAPSAVWGDYIAYLAAAIIVGWVLNRRRLTQSYAAFRTRQELYQRANSDPLTGALNRGGWQAAVAPLLEEADRRGSPVCLLYLDLDRFKRVNDRLGHAAGDALLVQAVATVRDCVREQDPIARLGGEEFAVLLGDTGLEQATAVAERIRLDYAQRHPGKTLSVGLALREEGESIQALLHRADLALLQAKAGGRNRVRIAGRPSFASA